MNTIDTYIAYFFMRQHMTKDGFKYNPSSMQSLPNVTARFEKDRFAERFKKIARSADPKSFLIGNFVYSEPFIAGFNESNWRRYAHFKQHTDAFSRDIVSLDVSLNALIQSKENNIPILLQNIVNGKTDMMTLIIMNNLLKFTSRWETQEFAKDKKIKKLLFKIEKLRSLIEIDNDADKYRLILLDHFERLKA